VVVAVAAAAAAASIDIAGSPDGSLAVRDTTTTTTSTVPLVVVWRFWWCWRRLALRDRHGIIEYRGFKLGQTATDEYEDIRQRKENTKTMMVMIVNIPRSVHAHLDLVLQAELGQAYA
jgi:hypothetical protein